MRKPSNIDISCRASQIYIRLFAERLSFHLHIPSLIVILFLASMTLIIAIVLLFIGTYPISIQNALAAFYGDADSMVEVVMVEWRLPRVVLALLLGAALAVSGAIFQSLTRNPLGSPDVMGFSAGSYTGALIVIIFFSGSYYQIAFGSFVGGLITALLVSVLAYRGGIKSFRLIIVGIGIAAMLSAFNSWLILKADLQIAMSAALWGAGSLNGLGLEQFIAVISIMLVFIPCVFCLSPAMRQCEMGEELALATGVNVHRIRFLLLFLAVGLVAMVTATAGPISFIALVAPQIAKRLTKASGTPLVASAIVGALLLILSDIAAQYAFTTQLPLGVMTATIGGCYFIWLLIKEGRK